MVTKAYENAPVEATAEHNESENSPLLSDPNSSKLEIQTERIKSKQEKCLVDSESDKSQGTLTRKKYNSRHSETSLYSPSILNLMVPEKHTFKVKSEEFKHRKNLISDSLEEKTILVAFVALNISHTGPNLEQSVQETLFGELETLLPHNLLPSVVVISQSLPTLADGTIDRQNVRELLEERLRTTGPSWTEMIKQRVLIYKVCIPGGRGSVFSHMMPYRTCFTIFYFHCFGEYSYPQTSLFCAVPTSILSIFTLLCLLRLCVIAFLE